MTYDLARQDIARRVWIAEGKMKAPETCYRVVTKNDGSSWVYRDNRPYCGPFPTRESALATVNYLEDGLAAFPTSEPAR